MEENQTVATDETVTEEVVEETSSTEETSTSLATDETSSTGEPVKKAPEEYGDFTLPENYELNDEDFSGFTQVAKELDLSQEDAQKLIDYDAKRVETLNKGNQTAFTELVGDWTKQAKEDKEIGGPKFDENMGQVRSVVDKFGDDSLKEMLRLTGTGNHPGFLKFVYNISKQFKEDSVHTGSSPDSQPKTLEGIASRLYPSMK